MERYQVILCALQDGIRSVLLTPGDAPDSDRWRLPEFFPTADVYNANLPAATAALREKFGFSSGIRTRYAVRLPNGGTPLNVYFTEPLPERIAPAPGDGSRWFFVDELSSLHFAAPVQGELLLAWLRDLAGDSSTALLPWWRERWIAGAENRLRGFAGEGNRSDKFPVEQVRSAFTSALLRMETKYSAVFLKTVPAPFSAEVRLTKLLSEWHPDYLPVVLNGDAIDGARSTPSELVLSDVGGESLGSHSPLPRWIETAQCYARLQSESVARVPALLKNGCLDLRVATLRGQVGRFPHRLQSALRGSPAGLSEDEWERLEALIPRFEAELHRLAAVGLPDTLEHGDLHVGNLRWNPAKNCPVFLDWSHACITFPFYGYGTLLLDDDWFGPDVPTASGRVEWAYLSPWAAYAGPEELSRGFVTWKSLRHLFVAERQMAIIESFQKLWEDVNRGRMSPCGDALRQLQWWLRDAARRLLLAHKNLP